MNKVQSQSNRLLYIGGVLSAVIIYVFLSIFPILTQYFEYKITDIKYSFRSMLNEEPEMNPSIVMVNLDNYSKIQSGKPLWPYSYYAAVIEKISAGEPTSIGVDILLTNTIDTSGFSAVLSALEESFLTINPYLVQFGNTKVPIEVAKHQYILSELIEMDEVPQVKLGEINHVVDIPFKSRQDIMNSSAGIGFVTIEPDLDGVLRRIPIVAEINGLLAPHFVLKIICDHLQYDLSNMELVNKRKLILHDFPIGDSVDVEIPLDGKGNMLVNYISLEKLKTLKNFGQFKSISAWDVIKSRPIDFSGKTVIFGDNSSSEKDFSSTPMDALLANSLIFSMVMSNILEEDFVRISQPQITLVLLIIFLTFFFIISSRVKGFQFSLISYGTLILYVICNFLVFVYFGTLTPLLIVFIPLFVTSAYMLIFMVYQAQVTMGVLEGSLSSLVSPHLMEQMINNPDILKLGGARKRITVLFSDIVGFTSFTDKADPAEVQAVLEEYFAEMASIIFANKGIVDKYMGDGILAFFENPPEGVISAQASIKVAMEMKKKADILDRKYKDQKRFPFAIYVGIATGYAKVGNIGPPEKVDYTIIGSVVNKASRLDGPGDPGDILMDEDTYFFVKSDYKIEDFGSHPLKGFEKPVKIYRLK